MRNAIYEMVGRFIVRLMWWRFGSRLKLAGGVLALAVIAGGWLVARREPPEG